MKIIQAKIINDTETEEDIKRERDMYDSILEMIFKEIILNPNDKCTKEENIAYLEYLLKDYIKEKENEI